MIQARRKLSRSGAAEVVAGAARNFFCVIISIEPMERFRGTWGHVTDQLNELEGLGTWITPIPSKRVVSFPDLGTRLASEARTAATQRLTEKKKLPRKVQMM